MAEATFTRYTCWHKDRILKVINKEAVSVDKSNFLATHAPLDNLDYKDKLRDMTDKRDVGLLNELKRCEREDLHAFMVVQGIPGTGKSHLIRWLKEMYAASTNEHREKDVVLLIERAHGNLSSTLQQIIQSGVFDGATMRDELEKLRTATSRLSSDTLADTLLDQIRNGTEEVALPEDQRPGIFIRKRVRYFLQDFYVREELKRKNGPIDRIKRYLSLEKDTGLAERELPGFEPDDFRFGIEVRRTIRDGGYKEARELVEELQSDDEDDENVRRKLATYFNRLLNYAVGRTTTLTADDLKAIFHELRRRLRQQGRGLALFIEDITAFTGIDEGLVDVLATQHTGEGNQEFCRLISVVGITDNYFDQHFPTNMKERVTHRVSLNRRKQEQLEAELLQSSHSVADLAARYLNAMRLSQEALDSWVEEGADFNLLPNACDRCGFKEKCHSAFGSRDINIGGEKAQHVGLYPFNEISLWTMFQQLQQQVSRTPRSLLSSVVSYVLQSHGRKIEDGLFPPPPRELGSDFKPPVLQRIAQRQIIIDQAPKDASRVESLVLFWGTRTVDTTFWDNKRLVGGLSQEVFQAFHIPFIAGEESRRFANQALVSTNTLSPVADPLTPQRPNSAVSSPHVKDQRVVFASPTDASSSIVADKGSVSNIGRSDQLEPEYQLYLDDINYWLSGESKLRHYDKLGDWLFEFLRVAIPWDEYGILSEQVKDRVRLAKMAIEEQASKIRNINDCFVFKRSNELAYVLESLVYLNVAPQPLDQGRIGGYLSHLSVWLEGQKAAIVDFVRRPTGQSQEQRSLTEILVIDCVLIACLQGRLERNHTFADVLKILLEDGSKGGEKLWNTALNEANSLRTQTWQSLMKNLDSRERVRVCRDALFEMVNLPQGRSSKVRFIDAAAILKALREFEHEDWHLTTMEVVPSSASQRWVSASEVYNALAQHFSNVISAERTKMNLQLKTLQYLIGDQEPKEIFASIQQWLHQMEDYQIPHKVPLKQYSATKLGKVQSALEGIAKEPKHRTLALRLSEVRNIMQEALEIIGFLGDFQRIVEVQISQLTQDEERLKEETKQIVVSDQVVLTYDKLIAQLITVTEGGKEVLQ